MEKTSLRRVKDKGGERKRDADAAIRQLQTTEKGGSRLADQLGSVTTMLSDVESRLSAARNAALDSVRKAGDEDAARVSAEETKARVEEREVASLAQHTESEGRKAEAAKAPDSRMRDGSEMARIADEAVRILEGERKALDSVATDARVQRGASSSRLDAAVSRNKK